MLFAQLCLTLCDPIDCSLPGPSVHGILQARILEWVAIPFSRGSPQPRGQTRVSCIAGGFFIIWAIREAPKALKWTLNDWIFMTQKANLSTFKQNWGNNGGKEEHNTFYTDLLSSKWKEYKRGQDWKFCCCECWSREWFPDWWFSRTLLPNTVPTSCTKQLKFKVTKVTIKFLICTSHISHAQRIHMSNGYCVEQ